MLLGLEIAGVIVGLIYLWLEYRASVWLWAASIVMPAIYIFIYAESGFYADMGINIYYLVASIYGWVAWLRRGDDGQPLKITHTPRKMILPLIAVGAIAMVVITYILLNYTDSTVPYGDSFTTALSVVALYMLARKQAEQWLVWLVVDAVSCALYISKGIHLTAALYGLYTILAWIGYRRWLKMIEEDATLPTA
ncbi:MAG: nicotinamide mononucleotide transporter [Rikenellaceae bacterium]|nr:nicotinamide mononucleotide transporter [Rikenellaceae bacterium]